jgi:hypothetical protein
MVTPVTLLPEFPFLVADWRAGKLALIDRRAKPAFRRDPYAVMPGTSPAMTIGQGL